MKVVLDGGLMVSREALHDLLIEKLELPQYYGRNLDALYDLLSEPLRELDISIVNADVMLSHLGSYGNGLLKTLADASECFSNVKFSVSNEII